MKILEQLQKKEFQFADVIAYIDSEGTHTPTAFTNGAQVNNATENQGSAKVFLFAKKHHLSKSDTLLLFAEHYEEVRTHPEGEDHQNIRQFMIHGWDGIKFGQKP